MSEIKGGLLEDGLMKKGREDEKCQNEGRETVQDFRIPPLYTPAGMVKGSVR